MVATIAAPGVMEVKMLEHPVGVVGIVMLGDILVRELGAAVTAPMVGIKMEMLILAVRHAPLVGLQPRNPARAQIVWQGNMPLLKRPNVLNVQKDISRGKGSKVRASALTIVIMRGGNGDTKMKREKPRVKTAREAKYSHLDQRVTSALQVGI